MIDVAKYRDFSELPAESSKLWEAAARTSFFFGLPWFETFAKHALDPGDELFLCYATDSSTNSPLAILPFVYKSNGRNWWRPRVLSSLSSYYSSLFAAITDQPISEETTIALARTILTDRRRWNAVDIRPLDHHSAAFDVLVRGLADARFVVQTYFCFGNWYLEVNGRSFDQYLRSLPSPLRNTLTRKEKKLAKSGRSRLELICGDSGLDDAIRAYEQVYRSSWKQEEPYPHFVPELMRVCAKLGALRLGVVYIDDIPAAAQFWIVQNKTAMIYKLAYDERFGDLSVGTILTARLMKQVIDVDRVDQVDYLTGDDAYKRDWMSGRRERWGILAMNPRTLGGCMAIARHVGGRYIKRLLRKGVGKRGRRLGTQPSSAGLVASSSSIDHSLQEN